MRQVVVLLMLCLSVYGTVKAELSFARNIADAFRHILINEGYNVPELKPQDDANELSNENFNIHNKAVELSPEISTTSGVVQGAKYPEGYAFYSVPYAQPPIRFQPPEQIVTPLPKIEAAESDMLVCEQLKKNCSNGVCIHNTNEDCLVLNINVPASVQLDPVLTGTNRPVLVWFHGGGFFAGGATIPEFESRYFSNETNSIIVTVNYRLGAYGFLVHGEGEDMITGNQGFKDQQLALKWVQDNIEKFGGDPDKVTIFGNSAGGQSVMLHLVAPGSKDLFHRAIMQSNPAVFQYQTLEEAKRVTSRLLRFLRCPNDTLENERQCLMDATPTQLNAGLVAAMPMSLYEDHDIWSTVEAFRPVLDGVEFSQQPFEMFQEGTWHSEKDLIVGTNTNELDIIQFYIPDETPGGRPIPFTEGMYDAINRFLFGEEVGAIVSEKYKSTVPGPDLTKDYEVLLGVEASHMFFMCPSRLMARFASNTSLSGNVFLYSNNHPMDGPTCPDVVNPPEMCGMAFHGGEPPFVFRSGPFYGYDFREEDTSVANQFDYYWANFARTGQPSNPGPENDASHDLGPFEEWPKYTGDESVTTGSQEFFYPFFGQIPFRHLQWAKESRFENVRSGSLNSRFGPLNSRFGRLNPRFGQLQNAKTTNPWQNIVIDSQNNQVEEGYLEEMCDFWDSLDYYVTINNPSGTAIPESTTPTPTTTPTNPDTSTPASPVEATTVSDNIATTDTVMSTTSAVPAMHKASLASVVIFSLSHVFMTTLL